MKPTVKQLWGPTFDAGISNFIPATSPNSFPSLKEKNVDNRGVVKTQSNIEDGLFAKISDSADSVKNIIISCIYTETIFLYKTMKSSEQFVRQY